MGESLRENRYNRWESIRCIPINFKNKERNLVYILLFNIVLKALVKSSKQEKEIKGIKIGKDGKKK